MVYSMTSGRHTCIAEPLDDVKCKQWPLDRLPMYSMTSVQNLQCIQWPLYRTYSVFNDLWTELTVYFSSPSSAPPPGLVRHYYCEHSPAFSPFAANCRHRCRRRCHRARTLGWPCCWDRGRRGGGYPRSCGRGAACRGHRGSPHSAARCAWTLELNIN